MKRKPVAILLAVLLVAVTCSVAFSSVFAETGENLFYNGDFTQHNGTTPEGWAIENANRYYSSTVSNTVVTPTGANTVVFTAKAAATGTFTTLYNTRSIQIQKNTKYTISYYIKDKNIPGLRFFLYEPDGLDRHGNAFHYEGPVNGRNIYSYYWDDGANTRIVRTEIKNDIVVENTGYKLRDSANIYANSMAYVEGTVNGSTQQLILTGDFDGTANGQKGTDQWVKIVHTFTTGNKNSHEALVRYGISVPGFAGGQVAVGGFTMLAEPVDVTLTPKVNNADLGYTAPATLSVGSKANFYAYALPGNEFTGWYESSAPNAKLLTNSPFYVFECTAGNASAALNYEARFSAGAGAVPAAGFENGYTAKQMLVRFNSAKPGTYLNKHENWACASDSALTWQQISVNSSVSHGGSHSVELNTRYSHAGYLVPVTLKPNTNYVLSFYGLDENIGNILNVRVLPYNQTPYVKDAQGNLKINTATLGTTASPVSATGTWTETTVQFNTGSNTKVSVWFNFAGPAGVIPVKEYYFVCDLIKQKYVERGVDKMIQHVGPNQGSTDHQTEQLNYILKEKGRTDLFDVYTDHCYLRTEDVTRDVYGDLAFEWFNAFVQPLKDTGIFNNGSGKEFWIDEFNCGISGKVMGDDMPWSGVQNVVGAIVAQKVGIQNIVFWQLYDQLWTDQNNTGGEFKNGIQITGCAPSLFESSIPHSQYYLTSLFSRYNGSKNGTVYNTSTGENYNGVYIGCVKLSNGDYTVSVVNTNAESVDLTVLFDKAINKTLFRHLETVNVVPETQAHLASADKTYVSVKNKFRDVLPAGAVAIYTSVKG